MCGLHAATSMSSSPVVGAKMARRKVPAQTAWFVTGALAVALLASLAPGVRRPPPVEEARSCEPHYRGHVVLAQAMATLEAQQRREECLQRLAGAESSGLSAEVGRRTCERHLDAAKHNWHFNYYRGLARNVAAGDRCALLALTKPGVAEAMAKAVRAGSWSQW